MKRAFCFAVLGAVASAHAIMIDDFGSGNGSDAISSGAQFSTQNGSMLGGDRLDALAVDSNPNGVGFSYLVTNGLLNISAGPRLAGRYEAGYGYTYVSPSTFNFDDLNANLSGANRFVVNFDSNDQDAMLRIFLQSNGGGFQEVDHVIAGGRATTPFSETVLFSEFSGVNFADVDQIILHLDVGPSGDIAVNSFEAVPEPASMACLLVGAAGVVLKRRRK